MSKRVCVFLILSPFLCMIFSLSLGQYRIPVTDVFRILSGSLFPSLTAGADWAPMAANLMMQVRLPRICAAMAIGAGLAISGAAFQGLFRNPLASPYTLGVSNGAGFGAALAILLFPHYHVMFGAALLSGVLAVLLTFALSAGARQSTVALVLAGVIVGSFFAALVSLLKFVADPSEKLPTIVFWLMGSLATTKPALLFASAPFFLSGMVLLTLYRWRLNILCLGDEEAASFGVDVRRDRLIIIACCTMITATAVSIAGIIGWVGLVIPHLGRMLVGADFRRLLPASASLGASYLLLIDDACRTLSMVEVPLGVVTAIIGTPIFAYFMFRRRIDW